MTQPPPQDPRQQPLQDDEVELARVLRALPGGEPSAKVDAAILAAATDAVAPERPQRRLRRLPTWAIGTAAAAVLAIAVGTQLRPPLEPAMEGQETTLPQAGEAAEPPPESESTLVELPPPAPARPAPPRTVAPPPRGQGSAPAAAPAKPVVQDVPAPAPAPPPPPPAPAADRVQDREADAATLDSIEVTGSRLKRAEIEERTQVHRSVSEQRNEQRRQEAMARQAAADVAPPIVNGQVPEPPQEPQAFVDAAPAKALPPVADDAGLPPAAWLERIRDRVRQGDRAGAVASLARFRREFPEHPLPDDLSQLRP